MTDAPSPRCSSGTAEVNPFANEPPASSPTPQIAGGVRERLEQIAQLTNVGRGDVLSLQDALRDIHSLATAALSPQARAGCTCPFDGCAPCPACAARPGDVAQAGSDPAALGYATRLLEHFVAEHFPHNPDWKPLPDLIGVLTQLDNATTIARDYKEKLRAYEGSALSSTSRETVSPASYCALCDLEHPLHEDAQGFHHVIKGERVACPMSSTHGATHD